MSNDDPKVQKALDKIETLSAEIVRWKQFVNQSDELEDRAPRFPEVAGMSPLAGAAIAAVAGPRGKQWKPGDFFNDSFSNASRRVLSARKEANGGQPAPGSVDDIHEALVAGSFAFDTSGAEQQKNSIRISLGKNSAVFVKLPGTELFGLREWYGTGSGGGRRPSSRRSTSETSTDADPGADEGTAGDAAVPTSDQQ